MLEYVFSLRVDVLKGQRKKEIEREIERKKISGRSDDVQYFEVFPETIGNLK